jgi:hypothetical protein
MQSFRDPKLTEQALCLFRNFLTTIPRIALENPVSAISSRRRETGSDCAAVVVWGRRRKTCLRLKNLPDLVPENCLPGDSKTRRGNQTASGQEQIRTVCGIDK